MKTNPCKTCASPFHTAMYHKRQPMKRSNLVVKELDPCSFCSSTRHYSALCPRKPKKSIGVGKVWRRWSECKKEWYKLYGTDHPCHYCHIRLDKTTITLDHKISRGRAPELRYDFDNLVPCCWTCNGLKGSLDHDEYKHTCLG